MRCAIVIPVGPGHEEAYQQAKTSVEIAAAFNPGPFDDILFVPIFDLDGTLGRSKARNIGVQTALDNKIEWIFFLDADDLMFEEAFKTFASYSDHVDALWGLICEADFFDLSRMKIRDNQLKTMSSLDDVLKTDPFLTLQMGHFVKTDIAALYPFDEAMNAGEDFKYYLSLWKNHGCLKDNVVLFVNRRGNHSSGPKSANGRDWRIAVERLIELERGESREN